MLIVLVEERDSSIVEIAAIFGEDSIRTMRVNAGDIP
jgi:hypothetical protein